MLMRYAAALALLVMGSTALADSYNFTVAGSSTTTWSLAVNAPFVVSGDPRSYLIGSYDAATNPTGTRTLPGLIGTDNGLNNPINLSAGGVTATGGSGSTPLHPAGVFAMRFDTAAGVATVTGLSLNLLNGSQIAVNANASVTYPSFRARVPTCTIFGGFPISLPLASGTVTGLTATQSTEDSPGPMTPAGANTYTFTIPLTIDVTLTATLNGAPFPVDPQTLPVVLTGTAVLSGDTASVTASLSISNQQTQPGPISLDPAAFDEPLCTSHLLLNIILAQVDTTITAENSITAPGVRTCTSASIATPPQARAVDQGAPVSFSVVGAGTTPLSYQWRRGTIVVVNGPRISGATLPTLSINAAETGDAGLYTCTLTNTCSTIVTQPVLLTVNTPPSCDGDYNQDGNVDQDDVRYLVNVIGGGDNPTGRDPDFNQDGNVDQDDFAALVNVVAGGNCP